MTFDVVETFESPPLRCNRLLLFNPPLEKVGLALTDARFDPEAQEILRDERKFCPRCESEMVPRTARKGKEIGQQFWGCSSYPRCRFTLPLSQR